MNTLKTQKISRGSLILLSGKLIGLLMGVSGTILLASKYGRSAATDTFFAAQLIPVIYMSRFIPAMASAFIPKFKELLAGKDEAAAWKMASSIINLFVLGFFLLALVLFAGSGQIIKLTAPGFSDQRFDMASGALRLLAPILFLTGFCGILNSVSYTYSQFLTPAAGDNLPKAGELAGIVYLTARFGINGIIMGLLAGSILNFALQLNKLKSFRRFYRLKINLRDRDVRMVLGQFALLIVTTSLTQVNLTVDQAFASSLSAGKLSALTYANRFLSTATAILPGAVMLAVFPSLSDMAARGKLSDAAGLVENSIVVVSFVLVPLILLVSMLAEDFIGLLLHRGNFTAPDITLVARGMLAYAPGVVCGIMCSLITPMFYAVYQTREVIKVGLVSCILNAGLDYILIKHFDYIGIAAASSICALFNLGWLGFILDRKIVKLQWGNLAVSLEKILLSSAAMALALTGSRFIHPWFLSHTSRLATILVTGIAVYLITGFFLRIDELESIYSKLFSIRYPGLFIKNQNLGGNPFEKGFPPNPLS